MVVPRSISSNTYATAKNQKNKLMANKMYARFVDSKKLHLFLESERKITIKTLRKKRVPTKNMFVVNGNKEVRNKIAKVLPPKNVIFGMSTGFLLRNTRQFGTIWMDYCCTATGNVKFHPADDFVTILSRRLVENNGIVGFTFSIREAKRHWTNKSVRKHKMSIKELKKGRKYKIFSKKPMSNRRKTRWENMAVDFCETCREDAGLKKHLEMVSFERYKKGGQMYVFFVRVNY